SQRRDRFGVFPVGRHSRYSFLFCIEDRHRFVDRPITSGYRNDAMRTTLKVFRSVARALVLIGLEPGNDGFPAKLFVHSPSSALILLSFHSGARRKEGAAQG